MLVKHMSSSYRHDPYLGAARYARPNTVSYRPYAAAGAMSAALAASYGRSYLNSPFPGYIRPGASSRTKSVTFRAPPRAPRVSARRLPRKKKFSRARKPRTTFAAKVAKAIVPLQTYNQINSFALLSSIGQCAYQAGSILSSATDYANMFVSTAGNFTGLAGSTNATTLDIESAVQETRIVNQDNCYADVELYLCVPRKDITANFPGIIACLQNGFGTNGFTSGLTDVTAVPFQSKDFCEAYKIVKVNKFRMMPGTERKFSIKGRRLRVNKVWASSAAYQMYQAQSKFWLFRVMGQPANDMTNKTNVNFSGAKIDFIISERYTFRYVTPLVSQHVTQNLMPAMAIAEIMEEKSGTVQTEATG